MKNQYSQIIKRENRACFRPWAVPVLHTPFGLKNTPGIYFQWAGSIPQTLETRLDATARYWCHKKARGLWGLLQYDELPSFCPPPWTTGRIAIFNWRIRLESSAGILKLRSFLGLCNFFIRFLPNFTQIAVVLNRKLQKYQRTHFETLDDDDLRAL